MDLSKIKKGLFAIKRTEEKGESINSLPQQEQTGPKITFTDYGFQQASRLGGTTPGLRTCLHKIYNDFKQEVKDDLAKQQDLKRPYKVKIEEYKGDTERLQLKIEKVKTEYIPKALNKIDRLKQELSAIKKNPQEVTGDDAGNASFVIGGIILLFLTVYLFIFYSSASYSAFFKEFSLNAIGVASSIFDPKALPNAYKDGLTELTLILTIPFVF